MGIAGFYSAIGADADTAIRRLGLTEKHLKKYLKKFLANQEFAKLAKAVAENDYKNVEWAAHSLKGVTSNLGLDILFMDFHKLVECVRAGKEDILMLYQSAAADYERVIGLLAEMDFDEE